MRNSSSLQLAAVSLALVASCSKNDPGTENDAGSGGAGGACESATRFSCAPLRSGACDDTRFPAVCSSGHWVCEPNLIPESECQCFVGAFSILCVDGGAGAGGNGGQGGIGGSATGGTGGGTAISCGDTTCTGGTVCLRRQTLGGACLVADGGCPPGYSFGSPCCVPNPTYSCAVLPAACNGKLTCDCARQPLCQSVTTCTANDTEIDCTLLAP